MESRTWYAQATNPTSPDAIHQICAFGTLEDIRELKKTVGAQELQKMFISYPKKVYTPETLNFIKTIILHISSPLDDQKYLKSAPRYTR